MRTSKKLAQPKLSITLLLLAASGVCLLLSVGLLNFKDQVSKERSGASSDKLRQEDQAEQEEQEEEEEFVWSSEAQDWRLVESEISRESFKLQGQSQTKDPSRCIWPEDVCPPGDRIINQLLLSEAQDDKILQIALANDHSQPPGQELFLRDKCRVNKCALSSDPQRADAIIWPNSDVPAELSSSLASRRQSQIWIAYLLESPPNTFDRRFKRRHRGSHEFNWTASYRSDSDIVTPYSKFVPYLGREFAKSTKSPREKLDLDYARASERHRQLVAGKKGARVAWLVSNCHAHNERLEFARELARFIQVDIYGKCGNLTCAKTNQAECLAHLNSNYKFYLSFENSNSREYITEKLYRNAHGYNDQDYLLLPIVMGPSRRDYERLAPPESFIHVNDFRTAQELASYLHELNDDHALYYSFFRWKTMGRFIDTKFLCRVCAMLHSSRRNTKKSYPNIQEWWWLEA